MAPISDGLARAVADRASVYLPNLSPDRDSDFDGAGALPATHASKQTFRAILAACQVTLAGAFARAEVAIGCAPSLMLFGVKCDLLSLQLIGKLLDSVEGGLIRRPA